MTQIFVTFRDQNADKWIRQLYNIIQLSMMKLQYQDSPGKTHFDV